MEQYISVGKNQSFQFWSNRYLWVDLQNLLWNIFGAVWDVILRIKTRLFKILNWNTFKILLSRNSSLTFANLSLQCMIWIAFFAGCWFFKICSIGTAPGYISVINVGMHEAEKNTFVFGNAGDKKNKKSSPGRPQFFFNQFNWIF